VTLRRFLVGLFVAGLAQLVLLYGLAADADARVSKPARSIERADRVLPSEFQSCAAYTDPFTGNPGGGASDVVYQLFQLRQQGYSSCLATQQAATFLSDDVDALGAKLDTIATKLDTVVTKLEAVATHGENTYNEVADLHALSAGAVPGVGLHLDPSTAVGLKANTVVKLDGTPLVRLASLSDATTAANEVRVTNPEEFPQGEAAAQIGDSDGNPQYVKLASADATSLEDGFAAAKQVGWFLAGLSIALFFAYCLYRQVMPRG